MDTMAKTEYFPGSLVRARGRDWIVLPNEEPGVLRLRPVDGLDAEAVGIYRSLEPDASRALQVLATGPGEERVISPEVCCCRDAVRPESPQWGGPVSFDG